VKVGLQILACLMMMVLCTSCTDESVQISDTPEIEFISISPQEVIAYQEKVIIRIKYTDGNGDLGENDPDVKNLSVTDSRNSVSFGFRIPELAPQGSNIAITGELPIEMDGVPIITEGADSETVSFSIQLSDRAGNLSNVVESDPITVHRE